MPPLEKALYLYLGINSYQNKLLHIQDCFNTFILLFELFNSNIQFERYHEFKNVSIRKKLRGSRSAQHSTFWNVGVTGARAVPQLFLDAPGGNEDVSWKFDTSYDKTLLTLLTDGKTVHSTFKLPLSVKL